MMQCLTEEWEGDQRVNLSVDAARTSGPAVWS